MRMYQRRRRAKIRRLVESLVTGLCIFVAYAGLGYAVCMHAFFNAPESWMYMLCAMSFLLQIIVILMVQERRTKR